MFQEIVFDSNALTLVGGGRVFPGDLETAKSYAPQVVAADGGANHVVAAGHMPDAVIGDFDSLTEKTRAQVLPQNLFEVTEQDSTDFEKALMRINARLVLGVGFTGARIDHELAVLHGLLRFAHKPVVLLGEQEVIFLAPPRINLDLPHGAVVSLFPLVPAQGTSRGLEWPIDGLHMAPGQQIGTSNKAVGGAVELSFEAPGMLLILPKSALSEVVQAFVADGPTRAQWPARGSQYKAPPPR